MVELFSTQALYPLFETLGFVKIPRLFFDLDGLDARTMRVVAFLGSTRAIGVFKLLKAQGVSLSYASIVKRLTSLCSQGILSKNGMTYSVNAKWVSEMQDFFDDLDFRFRQ